MKKFFLALLSAVCFANPSFADWPERPIKLVVSIGAGANNDVMARHLARNLTEELGKQVFVENRPGAAHSIGAGYVVNSPPDGYTVLITSSSLFSGALFSKLSFDPLKDLIPVIGLANSGMTLQISSKYPSHDAFIKAMNTKENFYAINGIGSSSHFAGLWYLNRFRLKAQTVSYRGPVDSLGDLIADRIDFQFSPVGVTLGLEQEGKIRIVREQTFPNWYGMFVPANTPRDVIDKLRTAVERGLAYPELKTWIQANNLTAIPNDTSPEAFSVFVQEQYKMLSRLKAENGL